MGKFSEAEDPDSRNDYRERGCGISQLLLSEDLDDDDRATVTRWATDVAHYTDKAVLHRLKNLGVSGVSLNTIQRHRRGECCNGIGKVR